MILEDVTHRYSGTSFFIRHLNDGQLNPSPWDNLIRQLAEAQGLPLGRFADACRILGFYYPAKCRRAWACPDEDHRAARGRHAQALAAFELKFNPAAVKRGARREDALKCIISYLRQGKNGYWLWEALVEDVQSIARLTAAGKERIARWFACGALRAYYPYIGGKHYWAAIGHDYDQHARHVLELIRFEYEFTRDHRDAKELERERRTAGLFASRLMDDVDRQICAKILTGTPSAYSSSVVPNAKGVYARFREPDDPLPMYVGMGNLRSAMASRHRHYSGSRPIYLSCFEDDDYKVAESKLLTVFDPPENGHHWRNKWIRHPDELPEWFSRR